MEYDTLYYILAVQRTTRRPKPSKLNCLLDGNCSLLFNWPHVNNLCHLRHSRDIEAPTVSISFSEG